MATQVSPGVDVSITDETFYASAGEGTVPLIIVGTHAYKSQPSGAGVAEGTLPENANKLYPIASQRELLQIFGNPLFYTKAGTALHGYELNEYGLHAAYQYLGVANKAYVIRGDVDYAQLLPRASAPVGDPVNGTFWLDTNATSWGVFESNGGSVPGTAWIAQNTIVIDDIASINSTILGTTSVADPSTGSVNSAVGSLILNEVSISIPINSTLQAIVNLINAANIPNVTASVHRLAGVSRLRLTNTAAGALQVKSTSTATMLTSLGLVADSGSTDHSVKVPKPSIGLDGDYAVISKYNDNVLYQKLKAEGISTVLDAASVSYWYQVGSVDWKAARPTRVVSGTPGAISTSNTLTLSADNTTLLSISMSGLTSVTDIADAINTAVGALSVGHPNKVFAASTPATELIITNKAGGDIHLGQTGTILTTLGLPILTRGSKLNYSKHSSVPANSTSGDVWVKTTNPNLGAEWVVKVYSEALSSWQVVSAPLFADDTAANVGLASTRSIGSLYVRYNLTGSSSAAVASHQLRRWSGSAWEALSYEASDTSPVSAPDVGTLWFNASLRVDIMVNDGDQWKGYKNYTGFENTDPAGVLLAGTRPTTQSDGSALVSNDLWIDTSDTENYPKLYRFDAASFVWNLVDLTDDTTPFGVVFADARWTANGSASGSSAVADMLTSDFVDPDAPDPRNYPDGMLMFNTRYSTNNIKKWEPEYLVSVLDDSTDFTQNSYTVGASTFNAVADGGRWVSESGSRADGVPFFGRKAQRQLIVRSLAETISSNENIRAEGLYFNLMAAPGYMELLDEMVTLNVDRKETAFIVGDTPARLRPVSRDIEQWASGVNSTGNDEDGLTTANANVGIYYPWGLGKNVDGTDIMVPPSTLALRTIAYNDSVAYQWSAPAGYTRGVVSNANSVGYLEGDDYKSIMLNEGQRNILYVNGINPIAYIPNRGLVVMGQKTRSGGDSAMNRINVVRLVSYLRYTLDNLARPYLFEGNDFHTRDSVQIAFSRVMGDLVGLRALYDFMVVCDETNNTAVRIDRNELWIDIAIQPEKTIEFIYIPVRIVRTGGDMGLNT